MLPLISSLMRAGRQMPFLDGPGGTRLRCAAIRPIHRRRSASRTALVLELRSACWCRRRQVTSPTRRCAAAASAVAHWRTRRWWCRLAVDGTLREPKATVDREAAAVAAR